jgi:hypothetical protein
MVPAIPNLRARPAPAPTALGNQDRRTMTGLDEADQEQIIHVTVKNVLEKDCLKGV